MAGKSFVRTEMLPEQAPPVSEAGILGWMREHLFSSPLNAVLTVVTVVALALGGVFLASWMLVPTWQADSVSMCREIMREIRPGQVGGACWGVIRDRGIQLLFGFYPPEFFWRPLLAFGLLFVALAPILFRDHVAPRLIWVSMLYPFLMPWLLWGGSIWLPAGVLAGILIGVAAYRLVSIKTSAPLAGLIVSTLVALLWWGVLMQPVATGLSGLADIGLEPVKSRDFGGFMLSVTIGFVAIGLSLPIGIVLALGRQSELILVKTLCVGFIEFIRGVPLITLLFVASTLLNIFMPPGTDFDIILRVIIMATLFSSAYMAEVVRGGLAALPKGQYEAADSLGLDYWKAQRLVIMPQALKISIPGLVNRFIALFKDTTLVSIIGLLDPLGLTVSIRANQEWSGIVWELYGFIALLFFTVCFGMSKYSMYLERKLRTDHH